MKHLLFLLTLVLFCTTLPLTTHAQTLSPSAAPISASEQTQAQPQEVVIKWKDYLHNSSADTKLERIQQRLQQRNISATDLSITTDYQRRNFSVIHSSHRSTEELMTLLQDLPAVEYVHPNILFRAQAQQTPWGINNGSGVKAIQAHTDGYTGAGVIVAVIDSGIDIDHEDLDGNLWAPAGNTCTLNGIQLTGECSNGGYDIVNDDTIPNDDNGHGTHVSGTIAAEDNTVGVVGVAPDAELMAIKVLDNTGVGTYTDIIAGIDFAIDNNADVINLSVGAINTGIVLMDLQDALDDAENQGITVVAAAGNNSSNAQFIPAAFEHVLSVGAVLENTSLTNPDTTYNTRLAYFSNWGKTNVVAPGALINSTTNNGSYSGNTWNGTSMASPHVAGIAALLKQKQSSLTPARIRYIIEETTIDLGATGKDEFFGSGLVDADAALAAVDDTTTPTLILEGNWAENSTEPLPVEEGVTPWYYIEPAVYSPVLPADGTTTTTMRVRLAYANGNPISSTTIQLSTTAGAITSGSTVVTNSLGEAEFTLRAAATAGEATITATLPSPSTSATLTARFADTLLVTDSGQPSNPDESGWYHSRALESLGVFWKMSPQPFAEWEYTLSQYDNVVWHTGTESLNASEQGLIKEYLDQGGHIFVSGGDIAYTQHYNATIDPTDLGADTVLSPYFKIEYQDYVAPYLTLVGDQDFETTGGTITDEGTDEDNAPYSDAITALDGGQLQGYYCSNQSGAIVTVDSTYKSVFVGTALEQLEKTNREEVINHAIGFLSGNAVDAGTFTPSAECDSSVTENDGTITDPNPSDDDGPAPSSSDSNAIFSDLSVEGITDTSILLHWTSSDDSIDTSVVIAKEISTEEVVATANGTGTEGSVDGLTPNTYYQFTVYGVYSDGTLSDPTSINQMTMPAAPDTPTVLNKGRNMIEFTLSDPAETGYQFNVELSNKNKEVIKTKTLDVGETTVQFKKLKPHTTYNARVRLLYTNSDNEEITGAFSDYTKVKTYTAQVAKPSLVKIEAHKVKIKWKKPPSGKIKRYEIQVFEKKGNTFTKIKLIKIKTKLQQKTLKHWIQQLHSNTDYRIRVRAVFTDKKTGAFSKPRGFHTP